MTPEAVEDGRRRLNRLIKGIQRWRLLPNEPWMERSILGEWVHVDELAAQLLASLEERTVADEQIAHLEHCRTCGYESIEDCSEYQALREKRAALATAEHGKGEEAR